MKLVNKADCIWENGILTCGDEVVGLPSDLFQQLDLLEGIYQMALYLSKQPDANGGPSLEGFEYFDEDLADLPVYVPETPALDAKVQESLAFLDEVDSINFCKEMNKEISRFSELFKFVKAQKFIPGNGWKFNLHYIGNPLELTEGRLMDMLEFCVHQRERLGREFPRVSNPTVLEF